MLCQVGYDIIFTCFASRTDTSVTVLSNFISKLLNCYKNVSHTQKVFPNFPPIYVINYIQQWKFYVFHRGNFQLWLAKKLGITLLPFQTFCNITKIVEMYIIFLNLIDIRWSNSFSLNLYVWLFNAWILNYQNMT